MPRTWSRRPFLIYAAAVVGPTLVVMALGFSAVRRQHEALETLRETNARLQESQIGEELERMLFAAAEAALDALMSGDIFQKLSSRELAVVDGARMEVDAIGGRHPIIGQVFVAGGGSVLYPRTDPPLLRGVDEVLEAEAEPVRAEVRRLIVTAERLQVTQPWTAAHLYEAAAHQAQTRGARALAMAGIARSRARHGDGSAAKQAWTTVAREFMDVYSPVGRPYAATAAVELAGMGEDAPVIDEIRDALLAGRWTLTPDLADYLLTRLPPAPEGQATGRYIETLDLGRRLRAVLPGGPVAAHRGVSSATLATADRVEQLFYVVDPARQQLGGFSADRAWIRAVLLPALASRLAPGAPVQLDVRIPAQPEFRPDTTPWRVSLEDAGEAGGWRRLDLLVFVAGTGIVLGVLVMGVVLLMRDVARETDVNRMRADLVSGVSHELKTPLSVIRIHAETIDEAPEMTIEERHRFTAAIVQETERLRRLVDDVVDFSRIQQGQRAYRLQQGSLAAVVARAVESFRTYAELHGYLVRAEIDEAAPPALFDPIAVEQALLNLLDNAAKYSGDSTEIGVRLSVSAAGLVVEVEDHGVGIAEREQSRIFDRFHRGAHADRGGYGLGLYLVRHIMEAHGGRVEVSSTEHQGSCFRLVFPAAPP